MDLDADQFFKDMESVMKRHGRQADASDVDTEEASSSDMDFGMLLFFPVLSLLNAANNLRITLFLFTVAA